MSAARSRNMAAIKGRDTSPELIVRWHLHAAGFRFRLHRKDLLGRPDIVLPKHKVVIFVHGCFGTDTIAVTSNGPEREQSSGMIRSWRM